MEGQFEIRNDSLLFVTSGGAEYRVRWYGFEDPGDPRNHGFNALSPIGLSKSDGTYLDNLNAARRYVQSRDYGAFDGIEYHSIGASAYVGVGGGVFVKIDRYGRVYLTINLGVGLGGKGGAYTMGGYPKGYLADEHELEGYMTGASVSGSAAAVAVIGGSLPAEGPAAAEIGSGFALGGSLSVDLTFKLFEFP